LPVTRGTQIGWNFVTVSYGFLDNRICTDLFLTVCDKSADMVLAKSALFGVNCSKIGCVHIAGLILFFALTSFELNTSLKQQATSYML
jgi:hypothetical protein